MLQYVEVKESLLKTILKGPAHSTGPIFFCKLFLNGASHDTDIGCISLVCVGAKTYKFSFLLCAGPLSYAAA